MTILLILLMNLLYAGTPTFMKLAAGELDSGQIVFLRHTLAALAFFPLILLSKKTRPLTWKNGLRLAACGFFSFALSSILQITGVKFSNAADGALIMGMEPVLKR